jgi:hypothetical protein
MPNQLLEIPANLQSERCNNPVGPPQTCEHHPESEGEKADTGPPAGALPRAESEGAKPSAGRSGMSVGENIKGQSLASLPVPIESVVLSAVSCKSEALGTTPCRLIYRDAWSCWQILRSTNSAR